MCALCESCCKSKCCNTDSFLNCVKTKKKKHESLELRGGHDKNSVEHAHPNSQLLVRKYNENNVLRSRKKRHKLLTGFRSLKKIF